MVDPVGGAADALEVREEQVLCTETACRDPAVHDVDGADEAGATKVVRDLDLGLFAALRLGQADRHTTLEHPVTPVADAGFTPLDASEGSGEGEDGPGIHLEPHEPARVERPKRRLGRSAV